MCGSMGKKKKMKYKDGGKVEGKFPDLTGDGKVTKKDILKGRGVKGMMGGGMVKYGMGGRVSSGKGCGIATSGRKFSGTY